MSASINTLDRPKGFLPTKTQRGMLHWRVTAALSGLGYKEYSLSSSLKTFGESNTNYPPLPKFMLGKQ
jgi:hypothetical protein